MNATTTQGVGTGSVILPDLPGPVADFWQGVQEGKLLLQRCRACGHRWHPPADVCDACRSFDVEWCESSGAGELFSYTIVHHAVHPVVAQWVPYTLCLVQLDEGPRILSTLVHDAAAEPRIGSRVRLGFRQVHGGFRLPVFSLESD